MTVIQREMILNSVNCFLFLLKISILELVGGNLSLSAIDGLGVVLWKESPIELEILELISNTGNYRQ